MKTIHVYIEGGGDSSGQRVELRAGFDRLFSDIKAKAAKQGYSLRFQCCGSRNQAYRDFISAERIRNRINVLLVDAEDPIASYTKDNDELVRVEHLKKRDKWTFDEIDPENVHLMVQCMEAWFLADVDALKRVYKRDFNEQALPSKQNLESLSKENIETALKRFTENTKAGNYYDGGKVAYASKILKELGAESVEKHCPRFKAFSDWLRSRWSASN